MKKIILILLTLACVLSCFSCSSCDKNKEQEEKGDYFPPRYSAKSIETFFEDFSNYRHGNFSEFTQDDLIDMEASGFHSLQHAYIPKVNVSTHKNVTLGVETDLDIQQVYFFYSFERDEPKIDPIRGTKEYDTIQVRVYQNGQMFEKVLEKYESSKKDFKKTVINDTVCCYEYGEYIEWVIHLEIPYSAYAYVQIEKKNLNLFCPDGITDYDNFISFDLYNVVDGELVKAE